MKKKMSYLVCTFVIMLCFVLSSGCTVTDDSNSADSSVDDSSNSHDSQSSESSDFASDSINEFAQVDDPELEKKLINETLVNIKDYIENVEIELKYASTDNFTGKVIYDFNEAYLRYGTVKKLAEVQKKLEEYGYKLKIWDACRPISAQFSLWEAYPDANYVANPNTGYSSHSKGNTVDVTIVTVSGDEVEMPSKFDDFTSFADRDYSDVTDAAAKNAELLENIMKENGFNAYFKEWWHYSDEENYAVVNSFANDDSTMWIADCNEYISLRKTASYSGEVLCHIPKGDTVELMEFTGAFAEVKYRGTNGYVLSKYITAGNGGFRNDLEIVRPDGNYTYEQMLTDIEKLEKKYPEKISVSNIGKSEEGRDIPVILIGDVNSDKHVLIQGSIHAREHMTAALLMCQIEYVLACGEREFSENNTVNAAINGVCFHIVPMSNPDGVILSQSAVLSQEQTEIYKMDVKTGYTSVTAEQYAALWKANAKGVDLNRNFDAGWDELKSRQNPSSERYKGTEPEDQAESIALADYACAYSFDATVSYHASGCVIYYDYGNRKDVIEKSYKLAQVVEGASGYTTIVDKALEAGGFKDWALEVLGIPSITIEIGCESAPLEFKELYSAYERNKNVFPAIAKWVKDN